MLLKVAHADDTNCLLAILPACLARVPVDDHCDNCDNDDDDDDDNDDDNEDQSVVKMPIFVLLWHQKSQTSP